MSDKKVKLHEILAFENEVKNKSKAIVDETTNVFTKKETLFDGLTKEYIATEEKGDEIPSESKAVTTTVPEKMEHTMKSVIDAIDVTLSKEETNASGSARAELIIGSTNFGSFSATGLLSLEGTLSKLRNELYKHIPTLDPSVSWHKDADNTRKGMFKSEASTKWRSVTRKKPIVAYPATEQHPAQVVMESYDEQVGRYLTTQFSGKVSPKAKADIIERLDQVIFAVKQARAKANNTDVITVRVAKDLFGYIHGSDLL